MQSPKQEVVTCYLTDMAEDALRRFHDIDHAAQVPVKVADL